ncbi:Asp-domain-containing protein [Gyrodon lividus]|nr:Asp-domain-containing protein [Gyrodon lividus]
MRFTLTLVIVALPFFIAAAPQPAKQGGTAIPLFKRSSLVNADKSVNSKALKSHVASTRAKILRGLDNFEKNTGASHPSVGGGARKRAATGNNLIVDHGIWSGAIEVGTPPDTYFVLFDTASGHVFVFCDLFLPGPDCGSSCAGHYIYDPSFSETSIYLGKTFRINFESGEAVSGQQYNDTQALDQTLGVASQYSAGFASTGFPPDGSMGMGFQSISVYRGRPVFQTLIAMGQTDEPVFAFSFTAPGPELYLGGINPTMYTGDISYTPVTQQGFWRINIDGIAGNGATLFINAPSIIDTGSELIHGPYQDVAILYETVGGTDASYILGEGYWTFPCDDIPSVSFTIAGNSFFISDDELNLGSSYYDSLDCVGAIIGDSFDGECDWLIGTAFLSGVYTIFDVGNLRVGFATLA